MDVTMKSVRKTIETDFSRIYQHIYEITLFGVYEGTSPFTSIHIMNMLENLIIHFTKEIEQKDSHIAH
jgi:hypothetical protein